MTALDILRIAADAAPVGFTKDGDPSIGGESRMRIVTIGPDAPALSPDEHLMPVMLGYSRGSMTSFTWRDEHGEHSIRREPDEEDDDWTRRCFKAMGWNVSW